MDNDIKLAPEEQGRAQLLWTALFSAPSRSQLLCAQRQLRDSPPCIQEAILHAIQSQETASQTAQNPFA